MTRLPTYFISHGGGPWPWIMDLLPGDWKPLHDSMVDLAREVGPAPKAILMISAHWETRHFTVQTHPKPPMYYDYGGFPDFTYRVQYPAPGSPEVAERVAELLTANGIRVERDAARGFDHGVFAPLAVAYPNADVPVLQLSIQRDYRPDDHLELGRALAPLRDEGVLIVGSGFTFHNLRLFGPGAKAPSAAFDAWLTDAVTAHTPAERVDLLRKWDRAPSARVAHPAEDHLIPLMVVVGAAIDEPGVSVYHQTDLFEHVTASSFRFGVAPVAAHR